MSTGATRRAGLAYAREWRLRNKPYFDRLYGSEQDHASRTTERNRGRAFTRQWRARRGPAHG